MSWIALITVMNLATAPEAPPVGQEQELDIESDMVIRGRVRKPQVFFVIPRMGSETFDEGREILGPLDEVVSVGAVDLSPARATELDGFAESSLIGAIRDTER